MATRPSPIAVTIYAYHVGFGDCFLVRFQYSGNKHRHVLIDFGTTGLPKSVASGRLLQIAEDIEDKCKGKLDAVVATHRHADHISGFATNEKGSAPGDIIRSLNPDVVVQPWTEKLDLPIDASTPVALQHAALGKYFSALDKMNATAESIVQRLARHPKSVSTVLRDRIEFIGEDNIKNLSAVKNLSTMGKKQIYTYSGGSSGLERVLPGVKTHVLGPPTLKQTDTIRKQRSTHPDEFWQLYLHKLAADDDWINQPGALFPEHSTISGGKLPMSVRWLASRLREAQSEQMLQIVRALDKQMNNTSVILLFEAGAKKLLFPGDAQWENWQYALSQEKVKALLKEVDLYKVGHHGSLNATPVSLWENFDKRGAVKSKNRLKTVLSTMGGKHGSVDKKTEVPRQTLVAELHAKSDLYSTEHVLDSGLYTEVQIEL